MSAPSSVGFSKLGAEVKARAPFSNSNKASSAPPVILRLTVLIASSSIAVTVVTANSFSFRLRLAISPPPSLVIAGAISFTSVMVTVMV